MVKRDFDLVVWDFDGVLNANIVDGRFVWSDRLQHDLGIDPVAFSDHVFRSGRMRDVVAGRLDILEVMSGWLADNGHKISGEEFIAYWWENDARADDEVVGWARALDCRQVIGTNNEHRRSTYIEQDMGFLQLVEHLFSSGRLGVAKPDERFFQHISDWSGLPRGRILLVDDNGPNVAAAQAHGWQAFHFTPQTRRDLPALLGL